LTTNIYSQSEQLNYLLNQIDYYENNYSYGSHVYSHDYNTVKYSFAGRGLVNKLESLGGREYNVIYYNLVDDKWGSVKINYSNKPQPSTESFEEYKKNKITSLKKSIQDEQERLLDEIKRKEENEKLNREYKIKLQKYTISEKSNLKIKLDSILSVINESNEGLKTYYSFFKGLDSIINISSDVNPFSISNGNDFFPNSIFDIPIESVNMIYGEPLNEIPQEYGSYYYALNVFPLDYDENENLFISYKIYDIYVPKTRDENDFSQTSLKDNITLPTILKIFQFYQILGDDMELIDNYKQAAESAMRFILFSNYINSDRWSKILNQNLNSFNYSEIDTTGFNKTGEFKWSEGTYESTVREGKKSLVNNIYKWYESEKYKIEKDGLEYEKTKNPLPNYDRQLVPIYQQFGKINKLITMWDLIGYYSDGDWTDRIYDDFKKINFIKEKTQTIYSIENFILNEFQPLFKIEGSPYSRKLTHKKHKQIQNIYKNIDENLSDKEKLIHNSLIGPIVDHSPESSIEYFYGLLHYGYRIAPKIMKKYVNYSSISGPKPNEIQEFQLIMTKKLFKFLDENNIQLSDVNEYIKKMKSLISSI